MALSTNCTTPRVQQLTLKTDSDTIRQMNEVYNGLQRHHDELRKKQHEAYQRFRRRQLGLG